jgi:hypothetical protein
MHLLHMQVDYMTHQLDVGGNMRLVLLPPLHTTNNAPTACNDARGKPLCPAEKHNDERDTSGNQSAA